MLKYPCGKVLKELLIIVWWCRGTNIWGMLALAPPDSRAGTFLKGLDPSFFAGSQAQLQLPKALLPEFHFNEESLAQALYLASPVINYTDASEICGNRMFFYWAGKYDPCFLVSQRLKWFVLLKNASWILPFVLKITKRKLSFEHSSTDII